MLGQLPAGVHARVARQHRVNLALTESPARHRSDGERGTGMGALPRMPKRPAKAPRPTARDRGCSADCADSAGLEAPDRAGHAA